MKDIFEALKDTLTLDFFKIAALLAIPFVCIMAWFTHIITCLADGSWGFLIAGALMFPIAIVHGIGIWFGAF